MHFRDAFTSSLQSIFSHKLRSLLTLLGIVIGVMAVVTMFSSVYALKMMITRNMESMGYNYSVIITPGANQRGRRGLRIHRAAQNTQSLNYSDYEALKNEVKHKTIYGMIESNQIFRLNNKDIELRIRATNSSYFENKTYKILRGRVFNSYEAENVLPVAVLGYFFAQEHYGQEDPIGKMLNVGNHRFLIIGILNKDELNSGQGMNFNTFERQQDMRAVYIPLQYGATYLSPQRGIHFIYLQAHDSEELPLMRTHARHVLLSRHNMEENFSFVDIGSLLLTVSKEMDDMMKKWNTTLSVIASISLIVGGIGLFSTLLISIQERMKEIGVRKSIGASEGDIFFYFIFEALTLALMGALIGVTLAWLALLALGNAIKLSLPLPSEGVALGTAFSLIIGFLSGLYPALKAAKIDPIQAIFYTD